MSYILATVSAKTLFGDEFGLTRLNVEVHLTYLSPGFIVAMEQVLISLRNQ
jgi:hypothetical protein